MNAPNSNVNAKKSGTKKLIMYAVLGVLLIVIIYIIYYAWQRSQEKNSNEPILISDIIDSNVARDGVSVPTPTEGLMQSMSTWIYVKDYQYNYGKYKNILWKGDQGTSSGTARHSPSIWLYPLTNNLKVLTSVESSEGVESCDINNIPLMKWVHIVYVLNNRTVDIYINGKLERSCALKGVPLLKDDNVFITGGTPPGYYGKIGKTQYFTRALASNEIAEIYNSGPIGASQYNVQFFQDGKLVTVKSNDSVNMS